MTLRQARENRKAKIDAYNAKKNASQGSKKAVAAAKKRGGKPVGKAVDTVENREPIDEARGDVNKKLTGKQAKIAAYEEKKSKFLKNKKNGAVAATAATGAVGALALNADKAAEKADVVVEDVATPESAPVDTTPDADTDAVTDALPQTLAEDAPVATAPIEATQDELEHLKSEESHISTIASPEGKQIALDEEAREQPEKKEGANAKSTGLLCGCI